MRADDERTVGDAPDLFVGLGEAAEALDVPHVWLHAAIREGRLTTCAGRREGRLVRLLRLGDLVALDPALADRPLPRFARSRPVVERGTGREPARPDPARPDSARSAPATPAASVPSRATRRARADGASQEESLRYLWGELERVRTQVRDSRERQDDLVRQLLESGEDARRLFDKVALDEESRRLAQGEIARERAEVERALAELRRARRATLASVSAVVLLAVVAIGYVARASIDPVRAADESSAEGSPGEGAAGDPPVGGRDDSAPADPAPRDRDVVDDLVAADDGTRAVPARLVVDPPEEEKPTPRTQDERLAPSEAPEGEAEGEAEATAERLPDEVEGSDGTEVVESAGAAPTDRALPGRPPAGERPGDRACALYAVTQPGRPLRGVLGPCWGRWNPALEATVGSSRNGDEAYCRQHAFFERALGASLARAQQEADLARDAGLVPPLLRMRVETAASAALAGHVPNWLESGFEAGSIAGHRVKSVEGDANHWLVESWVRFVDFAGNDRRRTFRLEVLLGDGPEPDRERSFAWTDEEPVEDSR